MNIDMNSLELISQFPFEINYETRDILHEVAILFEFKNCYHFGNASYETVTKYSFTSIKFITIPLSNDIFVSLNYNNFGDYLVFVAKKDKVFEYRNYKNEAWIKPEHFRSFEGLNVLSTIGKFRSGEITENLHEVNEGFAVENFSLHGRNI